MSEVLYFNIKTLIAHIYIRVTALKFYLEGIRRLWMCMSVYFSVRVHKDAWEVRLRYYNLSSSKYLLCKIISLLM